MIKTNFTESLLRNGICFLAVYDSKFIMNKSATLIRESMWILDWLPFSAIKLYRQFYVIFKSKYRHLYFTPHDVKTH